ncbi:MAG TPA: hypothetical protein VJ717_10630, partial [Gemmatimonadaceae bacterium]|nr:hypothetical protein [Gemmatimonadaceae bacterium]
EDAQPAEDPLENFARDGISALQRFGAELEAMLVGADGISEPPSQARPRPEPQPEPAPPNAESPESVEEQLRSRLVSEGVVVRGVDVARVVALATGTFVSWTPDPTSELSTPAPSS